MGSNRSREDNAAASLQKLLEMALGAPLPVPIDFWDGSTVGPNDGPGRIVVRSRTALAQLMWHPTELGLAGAFVNDSIDIDGDFAEVLRRLRVAWQRSANGVSRGRAISKLVPAAIKLGALSRPPRRSGLELRQSGHLHSKRRDAAAIEHHYDVGNDFYEVLLGPAMTYSCARFEHEGMSLEAAQRAKHELICRKLGLDERPGMRLLDVGCGWGSMAVHAATEHGAQVVGVTLSPSQFEYAQHRVKELGLIGQVDIRLQDYRDLGGENFDAISSVGMFEHVGKSQMATYFETLRGLLTPKGRLLNHAISKPGSEALHRHGFINRYVFPDGHLLDVADVAAGMEQAGFEVRDVESLREHYATTLAAWRNNLEAAWDKAVAMIGVERARVWRLYIAASENAFHAGSIAIHQVLGVAPTPDGVSGMPRTRRSFERLSEVVG